MNYRNELLTVKEVADNFNVTRRTIVRWVNDGLIPVIRINERGDMRFLRHDIKQLSRRFTYQGARWQPRKEKSV